MMKKRGAKQKHHTDSKTGLPVIGLSRMTDGRWRIIGSQKRFSEADEQKAIATFRRLSGLDKFAGLNISDQEKEWLSADSTEIVENSPASEVIRGFAIIDKDKKRGWRKFWRYVGNEIRSKPKLIAEYTGIEELAYIKNLKPPKPLPSLKEIADAYRDHAKVLRQERSKVCRAWQDFCDTTKIKTVEEIDEDIARIYKDAVYKRENLGPKSQKHLFSRIRGILNFMATNRGVAAVELQDKIKILKMLKASGTSVSLDPNPVSVADFKALLKAATSPDDKAMLLLMLNCAMYMQEALNLRWDDIKEGKYLVSHRRKLGKCVRVAVLWNETIDALKQVKRKGDSIFVGEHGLQLGRGGAGLRWTALAAAAEVQTTPAQLRDGAYTAAVQAKVDAKYCKLLAGHRCGIEDHYVKRDPSMVQSATDAVYKRYFTK